MTAGTSSVETTNEASRIPIAIPKPICLVPVSLFSISVPNDAASASPAAVIAGATCRTARAVASRLDAPAARSSRSRCDIRML